MTFSAPNFAAIPAELKALPRWVTWRAEAKGEGQKEAKIPYAPGLPNTRASSTDSDTWGTFAQAEASFYDGDRTGVGFVLNNDGLVGVDIDHCIDPEGTIHPDALSMLDWLGAAYVERSPTGTGIRAFGYAPPLDRGVRGKVGALDVELYSTGRYLTVTGDTIKTGPLSALLTFSELAHTLRGGTRVNTETGEILEPHDRHAALIHAVLSGDVFHDSLRDLAASFIATGMHPGAAVSQLRALMQVSAAPHDPRWEARYADIPRLVRTAQDKFSPATADVRAMVDAIPVENVAKTLDVVFAEDLPSQVEPVDELVEGVLVSGGSSIVYGDSNSGKTFFVLDLCCAIARGVDWMGRKTEPGLVIYLATESPRSIMVRVQAYQMHHGCTVKNLAIVRMPVNFYRDDSDALLVQKLITHVAEERKAKPAIIVGDTMARIAAGANENSGEDMAPVMARFDTLSRVSGAHTLVIHHSGKDAAKGARGWSGIRAHIDTEIEITENDDGSGARSAVITKQRELPGKGDAIGFSLKVVEVGLTKWGKPSTTCVVQTAQGTTSAKRAPNHEVHVKTFQNAWYAVSGEVKEGVPYLSRAALRQKLEHDGRAARTIANDLNPAYDRNLIGGLILANFIRPHEHGWIVTDPGTVSQMLIAKSHRDAKIGDAQSGAA